MRSSAIEGNHDAGFGVATATEMRYLTPNQAISVGKRMLVSTLERTYNVAHSTEDANHLTRVLVCPHCPRSIAEYGDKSLPSTHPKGIFRGVLELAQEQGVEVVPMACNHHGGEVYDPLKDLELSV